MEKVIARIGNIITFVIIAIAVVLLAILLVPKLFQFNLYTVLSGSMEPQYKVGSIVYIKKVPPEQVKVGDSIAFRYDNNIIVTHRVVESNIASQAFVTKGDANNSVDTEPVTYDQVIGVGKYSIPYVGYLTMYIRSKQGVVACVVIFIIIILLQIAVEIVKPVAKTNPAPNKGQNEKINEASESVKK